MRRTAPLTLLILLTLFTASAAATVSYDITVGEEMTTTNVTFELFSEDPVNSWKARWSVPTNATILTLHDSIGTIEEYQRNGDRISFETNSGDRRHREVITLAYRYPTSGTTYGGQVTSMRFQLSGLPDRYPKYDEERTQVEVTVPEPIIGTAESTGFQHSREGRTARFSGEGPVNIVVTYGEDHDRYEHFTLVGDANLSRADEVYPLLYRITGYKPSFRSMAVVILPKEQYNEREWSWSAGTYHRGGLITINGNTVGKETFTGTVIHEAMHGFNQRQLDWTGDTAAVIDEGTAQYAEWLVNRKLGAHVAEIFGETTEWTAPCGEGDGQRCRYTLQPRLTPSHLISYYEGQHDLMQDWVPSSDGRIELDGEFVSRRTFGYAFSELLVRYRAMRSGPDSIRKLYEQMRTINGTVSGPGEYWETVGELFGTTQPCHAEQASAIRGCLNRVNGMEPTLPSETDVVGGDGQVMFTPIETAEQEPPNSSTVEQISGQVDEVISPQTRSTLWSRLRTGLRTVVILINDLLTGLGV